MTLPPVDSQRYLRTLGQRGYDVEAIVRWMGDVERIHRFQGEYSQAVARLAERRGLDLIDVRSRFLEHGDWRGLVSADGIHPSQTGYELIYETCLQRLRTALLRAA